METEASSPHVSDMDSGKRARRLATSFLRRYASAFCIGLACAVVMFHFWVALTASTQITTTFDEVAHLTAGRAYWEWGDFRLQPENGNLPQRWQTLPNWLAGDQPPPARAEAWKRSDVWKLSYHYLYEQGNPLEVTLLRSRAMNLFWNVATAILVFSWSWRLFGRTGAMVSLILFCADPNFLAHGALATSDACAAFFLLASTGAWWRHLRKFDLPSGLVSALTFGLACVAKFSAVLLLPIMGLLLLLAVVFDRPEVPQTADGRPRVKVSRLLLSWLAHGLAGAVVIWMAFNFRFEPGSPELPSFSGFYISWDSLRAATGVQGAVIAAVRDLHVLPEAFLYGYNNVVYGSVGRLAFAGGEYSREGWWWFFPFTFIVKTPIATMLALLTAAALVAGRIFVFNRRDPAQLRVRYVTWLYRTSPLLLLPVIYGAFAISSNLNIGHRHLLPIYPALFILAGVLGTWEQQHRFQGYLAALALLSGTVVATARVYPHPLAFFNSLAGGPDGGWRCLADSSLDWGQDLPGLADWLDADQHAGRADSRIYLSYFGAGSPEHFGIRATRLPSEEAYPRARPWYDLEPGTYCVGATVLQQIYSRVRPPWTVDLEEEFQSLRELDRVYQKSHADLAMRAIFRENLGSRAWPETWRRFDELRFSRLCHYLRVRKPDAKIGWSIFIYRLSQSEINQVANGTLDDWIDAIGDGDTE